MIYIPTSDQLLPTLKRWIKEIPDDLNEVVQKYPALISLDGIAVSSNLVLEQVDKDQIELLKNFKIKLFRRCNVVTDINDVVWFTCTGKCYICGETESCYRPSFWVMTGESRNVSLKHLFICEKHIIWDWKE